MSSKLQDRKLRKDLDESALMNVKIFVFMFNNQFTAIHFFVCVLEMHLLMPSPFLKEYVGVRFSFRI